MCCSAGLHAVFYLQGYIQHIDRLEEEAREKVCRIPMPDLWNVFYIVDT